VGTPYVDKLDPWSSHAEIRRLLADSSPGARILDVGAATGTLGRLCAGAGFVLDGLEVDRDSAAIARPFYDHFFCGTLAEAPDELLRGHDVIVLADLLEHLADPAAALRRLLGLQPAGCRVLVSLPNVANLWVRLQLLLGRFDYAERGILDRTHLRFFTRRTLLALLRGAGLEVRRLAVTPIPLDQVHRLFAATRAGRLAHGALAAATRAWPTLLGYQFVALAVKPAAGSASTDGGRD
jgi:2-polyprenyl-3-methyl-5-hydroxy-6-metoxy-1,4-benzoquinol methylase